MLKLRKILIFLVLFVCSTASALAADITGQWEATFDTQIGRQHYVYTFKVDGERLTGTARSDSATNPIVDGKIRGDNVSFVENIVFQGERISIIYVGKIKQDEIDFTRTVGSYATEELVAKRVK